MTIGQFLANAFPFLAILALAVMFWADAIETKAQRRARANRIFWA